jgi:acetyl esterase/lipase
MKSLLSALAVAAALAATAPALAQMPRPDEFMQMFQAHPPTPAAAPDLKAIPLSATGSSSTNLWETMEGWRTVRNVTQPALYPVLPEAGKANGTAVIIAPGGAFLTLAFDTEGYEVARYLAARGVTCFVLTYRVDPTPADIPGLARAIVARIGSAPPDSTHLGSEWPVTQLAKADGLAAMSYVREHAGTYGIDPHRIGFMGFSAGGMTTMNVATAYVGATRPDFIGVIYGASPDVPVPADAPPAFIAQAADDPLLGHASEPIFDAWRAAGHDAELHIYAHGSHGFGMRKTGTSADHWIEDYVNWLHAEGLMPARP